MKPGTEKPGTEKPMIFHKPKWDKTGDPTIDPTMLDPNTGLPTGGRTIASLSKKNQFTAEEWQEVLVAAGLVDAEDVPDLTVLQPVGKPEPVSAEAAGKDAKVDVQEKPSKVVDVPEKPQLNKEVHHVDYGGPSKSVPVGVTADEVAAAKKAALAARIAKAQATRARNKAKGKQPK